MQAAENVEFAQASQPTTWEEVLVQHLVRRKTHHQLQPEARQQYFAKHRHLTVR
jgi:hypothetical protein